MFRTLIFLGVISITTSCRVTSYSNEAEQAASRKTSNKTNSSISKVDSDFTNSKSTDGFSSDKDLTSNISNSGSNATTEISNDAVVNVQASKNPNTMRGYASEKIGLSQSAASSNNLEYRIQLGIFKNLNAKANFPVANVNRRIVDDKLVYEISGFMSPAEANNYAKSLRKKKKKLKGTFVTKYIDGQRDYNYDARRDYSVGGNSKGIQIEEVVVPVETVNRAPNKNGTIEVISPSNAAKKKASIILQE
jgi:hypothetical protein